MVVKLTGTVEGNPVIFERQGGDTWTCVVPATLSGTYVAEFTAIDDAGNVAYCAQYIIAIDLSALCVHLEPCPWKAELIEKEYVAKCILSNYYAELMRPECGGTR